MMYNPAFDPFHGIYRMLLILRDFQQEDLVEVDRLRIYDFYLLFPYKAYKISLRKDEQDFRKQLRQYVSPKQNPYNESTNDRRLLEQLRPYQMIALSHLASYGLISPQHLLRQQVKVADAGRMRLVTDHLGEMPAADTNVISWLNLCFRTTPLSGVYGLKYRTQLLEYKYDGC